MRTFLTWLILAGLIGGFLGFDYACPELLSAFRHNGAMVAMVGVVFGQVVLAAIWSVLAPGHAIVRCSWSLLLLVMIGHAILYGGCQSEQAILLGLLILGGFLIATIALWIAWWRFRWRLAGAADYFTHPRPGRFQFHLRHLLLVVTFVAIALAPIRMVFGKVHFSDWKLVSDVLCAVPIIDLGVLLGVWITWGAFSEGCFFARFVVKWLFGCAVFTCAQSLALAFAVGAPLMYAVLILLYMFPINLCQGLTVFATLMVVRTLGFRLIREPAQTSTLLVNAIPGETKSTVE